jgi:hypothetical protein
MALSTNDRQAYLFERFKDRLANSPKHIFSPTQIMDLVVQLRAEYSFPRALSERKFQRALIDNGVLREIPLTASHPFEVKRYHAGAFSDYELALSLKPGAYLSHGTAAQLHNLISHKPTIIYLNKEQSPKNSKGNLSQAGIHRAFANKQRTSAYIVTHELTNIVLLSGKHSGRLGLMQSTGSQGEQLELTDIERTLIDIAVRPTYAGGANAVAKAYRNALPKTSVLRIATMLAQLNYIYPYHQSVGFYLQNAGHDLADLQPLRDPGLAFDFYLEHGGKQTRFDSTWRVHFPEDLFEGPI